LRSVQYRMAKVTIDDVAALRGRVGTEIALSDWLVVEQERIDRFAAAVGDFQWIHVDVERARRESAYGGTVAHGFLTLSLISQLLASAVELRGVRMGVNYGLNRVRFTGPVPAGSRVRARFALAALDDIQGGVQFNWNVSMEREGAERPVLVAEWLVRRYL